MTNCPHCGKANPPAQRKCRSCQGYLPVTGAEASGGGLKKLFRRVGPDNAKAATAKPAGQQKNRWTQTDMIDVAALQQAALASPTAAPPQVKMQVGRINPEVAAPTATPSGPRLVCRDLPPVPLAPGIRLTIGREDFCDIVLVSSLVSRRHAVLTAVGRTYCLIDLGSANGTFVNGVRLQENLPMQLTPGDVLSIGNITMRFATGDGSDERRSGTQQVAGGSTTRLKVNKEVAAGLQGKLSEMSLLELLQSMHLYGKSGVLRVFIGADEAWIMINEGELHAASFAGLMGAEAIRQMLMLADGDFVFQKPGPNFPLGQRQFTETIQKVLIDFQREMDERARQS